MNSPLEVLGACELRDEDLELRFDEFKEHIYHKVPTYYFRMMLLSAGLEAGTVNLRAGSTPHVLLYAGHIGYSVHEEFRGHRFAARSVKLLLPLARSLELDPLWITCDPENLASRRSLELAGGEFVEVVDVPETCGMRRYGGKTRKCRYRL
jgi:predicted acetyltransferase